MEFTILGPLAAREEGVPVALGGRKQRALLAVLLLNANRVVSTERLVDALWEEPPERAVKAVQVYVARLRKALGGGLPVGRAPGYLLELEPGQLDLTRFEMLVEEARGDPACTAERLREALSLWRGPPLGEFAGEPFARAERLRLEELRLAVLEERIEAELRLGQHARLVGELEALVAEQPLRESARGQLMLALYRSGRQGDALAVYRDGRRMLVEELGIEPGRALQQLERAILRQDPALELEPTPPAAQTPARGDAAAEIPRPAPREERKMVSVLFVDLVGFTTSSDRADPEDVRAALRPFHAAATSAIERFGGTVEKVVGDAVLAVFGAPVTHEDDPERAVRAALAIRDWIGEEVEGLQVRMAVNTGTALVAFDARPHESKALAAGDVVNTTRRIQAAAPVNAILVGEQAYRATREAVDYREAAAIEAMGKTEPIPVWEALAARPALGVDLLREPRTPLVGRQRELALLVSTLARVREDRSPQLVTLVGVPGIGKSRLVVSLLQAVAKERDPVTWRQGRCLPYGDGVSFWALGEIVKAQAGILESDTSAQAEQKLHRAVAEVITQEQEVPWVEQQLRPLVGAGAELGSGEASGAAVPAWRRFFEGLADLRPLVLVLEDLHWADEGLLAFADELAERVRDAPLLVLCTARPELLERQPGWGGGKANALTISLPPLSDDETARLVAAVLERPALEPELLEALLPRAAGNPLYAEQFARVLAEIGTLDELPETVHGIIAARLDGLTPQEKALLQDAAVVGKVFWPAALEAVGDTSGQTEELLFGLERKEFVQRARQSSVAGEAEYAFRHVLLRDVAYGQIPRARRGDKHRRAAVWIQSLGRPDDHAEMLAHHYLSALEYAKVAGREDPALVERARLALRAAGERALALASYAAAARLYRTALEFWPEEDPDRVWLLVHAGRASHAADGTGIDLLEQAFDELHSRGDADGAAEVAVEVARRFWLGGDRDAAYVYIDRALELVERRRHSRARAYALVERAAYHMGASEHPQAIRLVREALQLTKALGMADLQVRALDVLGSSRASVGDFGGLDDAKQAIALARERNLFSRLIVAELNLQGLLLFVGQVAAASEALRAYRHDVESHGTADQRNWSRASEAHEAVFYGRWEEAARILDERIAEAEAGVTHYSDPACRALRASIALARGDLQAAAADSEKALERARSTKDPQLLAPTLALRAIVQLAQGQREEALRLGSEVLARGSVLVTALLELHPTVTPIEFAWLIRDLGREAELVSALESVPPTPWHKAARAIAEGDLAHSVELVARLGAPSVDAYARLRAADELMRVGRFAEAHDHLESALVFFRKVGATRYLAQAEQLLAAFP